MTIRFAVCGLRWRITGNLVPCFVRISGRVQSYTPLASYLQNTTLSRTASTGSGFRRRIAGNLAPCCARRSGQYSSRSPLGVECGLLSSTVEATDNLTSIWLREQYFLHQKTLHWENQCRVVTLCIVRNVVIARHRRRQVKARRQEWTYVLDCRGD